MKSLKVISIIAIFFYISILFFMTAYYEGDSYFSLSFLSGIFGIFCAIAFAIFVLFKMGKKKKHRHSLGSRQGLLDLHELMERSIITDEEYQIGKAERKKKGKHSYSTKKEFLQLLEYKEKGILTEEEYQDEKMKLLLKK